MATDYEDPIYTPAPKSAQTPPTGEQPATPPNTPPPPSPSKDEARTMVDGGAPQTEQQPISGDSTEKRTYNILTTIPDEFKGSTDQELIDWLERKLAEHAPLSKEDEQKLRRKQRTEGIIAGITDAVQSVANLVATSQYAPNMYNGKESMSAKAKTRFEKEKAERQAEDEQYFNYLMNLAKLKGSDRDRALNIFNLEQNMQRQERAYEDARADRASDEAYRKARAAATDAWKQKEFDEDVRQFNAGISAGRYSHSGRSGGSESSGEYPWYDRDGNLHYAKTYEAMRQNALQHGTWEETTQSSTTEKRGLTGSGTSTTTKPGKGYSKKPEGTGNKKWDKTSKIKW